MPLITKEPSSPPRTPLLAPGPGTLPQRDSWLPQVSGSYWPISLDDKVFALQLKTLVMRHAMERAQEVMTAQSQRTALKLRF